MSLDDDPQRTAPIACSLDVGGLRTQGQRWSELVRDAGTGRTARADGVTLTFRADTHVERQLRQLAAVENECCAWAHWQVQADGERGLVMRASATGDGVAVLQSMFAPDS